jgi:hypothetical protein
VISLCAEVQNATNTFQEVIARKVSMSVARNSPPLDRIGWEVPDESCHSILGARMLFVDAKDT